MDQLRSNMSSIKPIPQTNAIKAAYEKAVENAVKKIFQKKEYKDGRVGSPEPGNRHKKL